MELDCKQKVIYICLECNTIQCNNVNGISIEYWVPEWNWIVSKKNLTSALTWPVTPWDDPV